MDRIVILLYLLAVIFTVLQRFFPRIGLFLGAGLSAGGWLLLTLVAEASAEQRIMGLALLFALSLWMPGKKEDTP